MSKVGYVPKKALVGALCFGAAAGLSVYALCSLGAFASVVGLTGLDGAAANLTFVFLALFAGVWVFLLAAQVLANRYVAAVDYGLAVTYATAMLWVVLGKSVGIRGINFDITDLFAQARYFPAGLFLNAAMFVPLGAGIRLKTPSPVKALFVALLVSVGLETAQYAFSLGIADVSDVAANVFGTMSGFLLLDIPLSRGLAFRAQAPGRMRLELTAVPIPKRSDTAAWSVMCIAVLAFGVGAIFYPVNPLSAVPEPEASEDAVLSELTEGSGLPTDASTGLACEIMGQRGAASPLSQESGTLKASGKVVGWSSWLTSKDEVACGLSVLVSEEVGGQMVSETVPVVVAPDSVLEADGESISVDNLMEKLYSSQAYRLEANLGHEGAWLKVRFAALVADAPVAPEVPVATFDWSFYSALLGKKPSDALWLDLAEGGMDEVEGFVASTTEFDDTSKRFATIAVVDETAGIPVLHAVNAKLSHDPEAWGWQEDLKTYRLGLENGTVELL